MTTFARVRWPSRNSRWLRRCSQFLLLFSLIFLCDSGAWADVKPFYVTDIKDDKTSLILKGDDNPIYTESMALLVGEVDYHAWDKLPAIPLELEKLTKALERQHFKVYVYVNLDSNNLINVIDSFMRTHGSVRDSRIVVYVSAHGLSQDVYGPLGYILPVDSPDENASGEDIVRYALSMPMFEAWAQIPYAKHVFFIFDACFSGAFFGYVGKRLSLADHASSAASDPSSGEGFAVDANGNLILPPKTSLGIESSDYALRNAAQSPGRQFLAAGDSDEPTPGSSLLVQLLVNMLDDKITSEQINPDIWTNASEMGEWLTKKSADIARHVLKVALPPNPVYGHLPNDKVYQQGDMLFARNEYANSLIEESSEDAAAWEKAIANPFHPELVQVSIKGVEFSALSPPDKLPVSAAEKLVYTSQLAKAGATYTDVNFFTPEDEDQLRTIIDSLSSDDKAVRRPAREQLRDLISGLEIAKKQRLIELLLSKLSSKSYRYQLGVATAIQGQKSTIPLEDYQDSNLEIEAALRSTAGKDPTLRQALLAAQKRIEPI